MLESWVRYEGQVKQRQQRELAEGVINKIRKELESPKQLQQILQQAVSDVESECLASVPRHCSNEKAIEGLTCARSSGIVSSKAQ